MTGTARETTTPTKGESLPGREGRLGGTRRDPLSGPYRGKRPIPDGEGASLRTQWGDAQKRETIGTFHTGARTSPHLRNLRRPNCRLARQSSAAASRKHSTLPSGRSSKSSTERERGAKVNR